MDVIVVPHDPAWAGKFERESRRVAEALGAAVVEQIHHIGSTAIPAIHAKPIVDMLVEVRAINAVDGRTDAMTGLGYEAKGEYGIAGRRYFRKSDEHGTREFHVHAFATGSPGAVRHLAFRDFMRAHPDLAARYSELKRQLVAEQPCDIDRYMAGKDAFIKEMERQALAWRALR